MNTPWKFSALTVAALLSLGAVSAQKQESKSSSSKKSQRITIVKTGDNDEKITVEVNGDKVTINGKPAEEYKGADVRIIRDADGTVEIARAGRAIAPMRVRAPRAVAGMNGDVFAWGGDHNRAILGVSTETGDGGARITSVTKGSAAEKAGLKEGDIITKVNEYNVADADDLPAAIGKFKPEDKVTVSYTRDGKAATASATLGKNEHDFEQTFAIAERDFDFSFGEGRMFSASRKPRLGMQVEDLQDGNGVKVLDVDEESAAAKAGLKKDDIITNFNGKEIKGVDDIRGAMKEIEAGSTAKISFLRAGSAQSADIKFPKPVKKASL